MSALYSFGLPELLAGLIIVALCAYAITGGADFGGGVWTLFASGPRRNEQRDLIRRSLAPIWGLNHVWLVVALIALVAGFPSAFSAIALYLRVPLVIMLVGIVARGAGFLSRQGSRTSSAVFSVASMLTPIFFGICVAALASGRVGRAERLIAATFADQFLYSWLTGFTLAVGLFALTLFAFLAAIYLAYASSGELQEDFRRRALGSAVVVFLMAALALALSYAHAERIALGISRTPLGVAIQVITGAFAVAAIWALWQRRYRIARFAAAAQTISIIWGWALAQFPWIIPEEMRIQDAAAPQARLSVLLGVLLIALAIVLPTMRQRLRRISAT